MRRTLHTADHSALLYSASDIEVLDAAGLALHPFLAKLGPDLLSDQIDWRTIAQRLDDERFRRRSLAALYLDQSFLAGVGNYLRSEILFAAALAPSVRPCDLSRGQRGELARATLDITLRSYQSGGITNTPRRVAHLKRLGMSRRFYRFAVFDRQHQPCLICGTEIRRVTLASRRLYFCPSCQA